MDVERIRELYRYNRWANDRMLEALSSLDDERYARDLGSSFPSIRDTVTHILSADWIWLRRWKGESPTAMLDPEDFEDLAAVAARWREVQAEREEFLAGLTPAALEGTLEYRNTRDERWRYPLWQVLVHVANHSTYHRGQLVTMLRQVEAEPPATDFLLYWDEAGEGEPTPP